MIRRLALPALALLAAVVAGCGGGGGYGGGSSSTATASSGSPKATAGGGTVATARTGLGEVLVDGKGHTLYLFERDQSGQSACSGACASNWPPAIASGAPHAGTGVAGGKLATIKRSDGGKQVAYAGHPLYRFSGDTAAGDTNGQGQDAFGGKWYAISPDGTAVTASGGSASGGGSGGGSYGGGY